jgi:exodeoxyribonuclease-3
VFKIITWNVNSIRTRIEQLLLLLKQENPDIVLLQEIKCVDLQFPSDAISEAGYNFAIFGQKTYNGVAILSKMPIEDVSRGLPHFEDGESRYIEALTYLGKTAIKVASVYVPNGSPTGEEAKTRIKPQSSARFQYKLNFLDALKNHIKNQVSQSFVFGGDMNVSPADIDVYNVANWEGKISFLPEEKAKIKSILNLGYADGIRLLAGNLQIFSWYDYRTRGFDTGKGLRIDHIYTSPLITDFLSGFKVLDYYRGLEKPSDHVPMQIDIKIP